MGFSLSEIKDILDSPTYDKRKTLEAQEKLLIRRKERMEAIIRAIRKTIENLDSADFTSSREIFTAFDMAEINRNKEKYSTDFRQKFGNTLSNECGVLTDDYTQEDLYCRCPAIRGAGDE